MQVYRGYRDLHGDSHGYGYGVGMEMEIPSPRQPWAHVVDGRVSRKVCGVRACSPT